MDNFRMPYGVGDAVLVAKANTIANAAQALASDFISHEHEPTFIGDLQGQINAFSAADTTQDTGTQTQAGATASFGPLLDDAMTAVKQLDAFMHNFYESNAAKMGEWHTASHIERQPNRKNLKLHPAEAVGTEKPTRNPNREKFTNARLAERRLNRRPNLQSPRRRF
jgi:hypothetical protein